MPSARSTQLASHSFCSAGTPDPLLYLRTEKPLPVVFAGIAATHDLNVNRQAVAAIVTAAVPFLI